MNRQSAIRLIKKTFEAPFNKDNFVIFLKNLLKYFEEKPFIYQGNYIPDSYKQYIASFERVGQYTYDNKEIDLLIVKLNKESSLERARTIQRNFIAWYLKGSRGGKLKDAALVAFVLPNDEEPCNEDWRFSLVKMDYRFEETPSGKIKVKEEFTPARRWSFLVGKNEKSHTAQSRFLPILEDDNKKPTLEDLEDAFNVETVTEEFFLKYRDLFIETKHVLDKIIQKEPKIQLEFSKKEINSIDFAKKLLGQITFLYFLQKKGWFGVERGKLWGTGSKDFIRSLFNKKFGDYQNFYNDILEPLFYEALRTDRSYDDHYYSRFNCKLPFLNGGLFDPINNYNWVDVDILIPNELFSNSKKTPEGDIGNGILDIFDRYNFTVNEEEPLEKEVALDPELLGKIYEKLNAIRDDNFNEYLKVLNSGRTGEETKFNKEYGVYYTPREIVHYMCKESLKNYLSTELEGVVNKEDIETFVEFSEQLTENEAIALIKEQLIQEGKQKTSKYKTILPESIIKNAKLIDEKLKEIKICDPAVGSGAFPIGMMHEIVKLRQLLNIYLKQSVKPYDLKRECIENSLYGVDIDLGAVEICKLRFWLSLVVDEEDFKNIKPLPNLDYKIVCGDSLLGIEKNMFNKEALKRVEKLISQHTNETNPTKKQDLKNDIDNLIDEITEGHKKFDFRVYFSEVFHYKSGFDIIIANPPYVSTKGVPEKYKKELLKHYKFADDLYSHFIFKGFDLLKENGIISYITSKTYWTIQTKKNVRELILKNKILEMFDTASPFTAMVDTAVFIAKKQKDNTNYEFVFKDGKNDLSNPIAYKAKIEWYKNIPNNVFFIPTEKNIAIQQKYGATVKKLLDIWWDKISTSKNIEKHKRELELYRNSLQPGDITLLGLITEGGQGLATANNGKYIGVLEGTKWAEKVKTERPEKLWEFLQTKKIAELDYITSKQKAEEFLNHKTEKEIRTLFDTLKEKYGRDIFGQGWLYRIVSPTEIANVETLTEDEKLNGIQGNRTFVPYDKGDKDGNRWYAPTPYYIDWSRENVKFLQNDPKARWQGYQFYFREGFCWTDVSYDIRARLKEKSIHDVLTMSLFVSTSKIDASYIICKLNSKFMSMYLNSFVNTTVHFQINDARQLPIIIPTPEQLKTFKEIFDKAVEVQKQKFASKISEDKAKEKLQEIQKVLDKEVEKLYEV